MNTKDKEMIESIIGALISISITTGGDYKEEIAWLRNIKSVKKNQRKIKLWYNTCSNQYRKSIKSLLL